MQTATQSRPVVKRSGGDGATIRTRPRLKRRTGYALLATLGLGLLVWFAPAIASRPWILKRIAAQIMPQLDGQLDLQSASLGWFSPIEFGDVVVRGLDGSTMLQLAKVSSHESLLQLASNRQHCLRLRLASPRLRLVLRPDGSNLEDTLSQWINERASDESAWNVDLACDVADGTIEFVDEQGRQISTIDNVTMSLRLPRSHTEPLSLTVSGKTFDGDNRGSLVAECTCEGSQGGLAESLKKGQLVFQCDGLPMQLLQPAVVRLTAVRQAELSGHLSSDARIAWDQSNGRSLANASGTASARQLACLIPSIVVDERLSVDHIGIDASVSLAGKELHIERLDVESDLGTVTATGSAGWDGTAMGRLYVPLRPLNQTDGFVVDAQLDLARLAATVPKALRLRDGAKLTVGRVKVNLAGRPADSGPTWNGSIETTDLEGLHDGQIIRWEHPLRLFAKIRESSQGIVVDEMSCDSDFLKLAGEGQRDHGQLSATGDLSRLMSEVKKFLDVHEVELAGQLNSNLKWRRSQGNHVDADGILSVENLSVTLADGQAWQERRLDATLSAHGRYDDHGVSDVERATLVLTSRSDRADVTLGQSVSLRQNALNWPVRCELRGDLTTWLARIEPFCSLGNWRVAGKVKLDAELASNPGQLHVRRSQLELLQFSASNGNGLAIREPMVKLEGTGTWNRATRKLYSDEATLSSSSLALRTQQLQADLADNSVAGKVGFRGDLARLWSWMNETQSTPTPLMSGDVNGWIDLSSKSVADEGQIPNERSAVMATSANPALSSYAAWEEKLAARGSLGWSSLDVFGLSIDPSTVDAQLSDGVVHITPLSLRIAEGHLTMAPRLDVRARPRTVVLGSGPFMTDVRISPEMCHGWLKYVAPIVADATSAEGRISVALNGARLRIAAPQQSDVGGMLTIHSAQVLPGPLAKPMLSIAHDVANLLKHKSPATQLLDPAGAWLEIDRQQVEFQMAEGRVYHRGLEMRMKDVTIRTRGWVAVDQTVSILAEIPVRDEWIRRDRILNSLRGKSIQVPIRGTINHPQVDRTALAQLTEDLIGNAAGQLLEDELRKQLHKLLPIR